MLVIADQRAAGIGRQRGLAGARQAEEHRGLAVGADVGAAVHRHHAFGGQQVVENAEDALLHLAGIFGAADQDQLLFEIDRDHGLAARPVAFGVGLEAGQVDDGVFGHETVELGFGRTHQQRADELVVPRQLVDHPDIDPVLGLRAAEQVGDEKLALVRHRLEEIFLERGEMRRRHRGIVVPPYGVFGFGVADDELVLRAAARVLARFDHQRTVLGTAPLAALQRGGGQLFRSQVGMNGGGSLDALVGKRMGKRKGH